MSKIFLPYKALGLYSGCTPLIINYHSFRKDYFITIGVGYVFHTYKLSSLQLEVVSDKLDDKITGLAASKKYIFASAGNDVHLFSKGRYYTKTFTGHSASVHCLLDLGSSKSVVSVDINGGVKVWTADTLNVWFSLDFQVDTFHITCIFHPTGYKNKLLFGSRQGSLQLWNIATNKQVYTFNSLGSAITCITQAPCEDVCAIGLQNGDVIVHNLKFDKTLMKFSSDGGAITCIGFRTETLPEMMIVTGDDKGTLSIWEMSTCRANGEKRHAHANAIAGLFCVPNHPYMITNSGDNSVKVWSCDRADGCPELIRSLMGHSKPPTHLSFWDLNGGSSVISAASDSSARVFSTRSDKSNSHFGKIYEQGKIPRKNKMTKLRPKIATYIMPPISHMAVEEIHSADWNTLAACLHTKKVVVTWNFYKGFRSASYLVPDYLTKVQFKHTLATCLDISPCANFVVVGYTSGHIFKFNIQSGLSRGCFGKIDAHSLPVTGVCINSVSQVLVSTGGSQAHFWNFATRQLFFTKTFPFKILSTLCHRDSDTVALVVKDNSVFLIDAVNRHTVRHFKGHKLPITDMTFSSDGKWLITAGRDKLIKTWDVLDAKLIDVLRVDAVPTSVVLAPSGDFLCISLKDHLGVYLWSNRTLYRRLCLTPLSPDYVPEMSAVTPSSSLPDFRRHPDERSRRAHIDLDLDDENTDYISPSQLQDQLVTLSNIPTSFWTSLINLDTIRLRNKPVEPPVQNKKAPFFLPTVETERGVALVPDSDNEEDVGPAAKKPKREMDLAISGLSLLAPMLQCSSQDPEKNFEPCISKLRSMGPSALDMEVALLSPEEGGSVGLMLAFLELLENRLHSRMDIDLVQALARLFLRKHSEETLTFTGEEGEEVRTRFLRLSEELAKVCSGIEKRMNRAIAMVHLAKNMPYTT